jgi:hypothetical protein
MNTVRTAERAEAHARSLKAAILAREGRGRPALTGPEQPAEGQADPLALKPRLARHAMHVVTLARSTRTDAQCRSSAV